MLPLIVIGADDTVRRLLAPYGEVGHVQYHPTAQEADDALTDALRDMIRTAVVRADPDPSLGLPPETVLLDDGALRGEEPRWLAHVAYGPAAYGLLMTGSVAGRSSAKLPHTGHTLVLGHDLGEVGAPVRVRDGQPLTEPASALAFQAAIPARADFVVDLVSPRAVNFISAYLEWKSPAGEAQAR